MFPFKRKRVVEKLISDASWVLSEISHPTYPCLIRNRKPVLGPTGVSEYARSVIVLWAYADEGIGAMPSPDTSQDMLRFENELVTAVEHDALAVLTAVLTFDGARQWVYYTRDLDGFMARLSTLPDYHGKPYPIELTTDNDPTWSYLRDQILLHVPADAK